MNYEKYQEDLLAYFVAALPAALDAINTAKPDIRLVSPTEYIMGYPDTLVHTGDVVFYALPSDYGFEVTSTETQDMTSIVETYMTIKGYAEPDLTRACRRYAEAVHGAIRADKTLGGAVDECWVTEMHVFDSIEGLPTGKAIKILLSTTKELEV